MIRKAKGLATKYILINTQNCEACWKCFEVCKRNVIGRVNLFFHKHAKISRADRCTGCKICIQACEHNAIIQLDNN